MDLSSVTSLHADWAVPLLMGIGLSACAGFRAWLPLLLVSALAHFGCLQLNPSMSALADERVLAALLIATAIEMIGDKVPALDNALDTAGSFLRPAAGTVVSSSLLVHADAGVALLLGVIVGGGTALSVHAGKSAVRLTSTASAPVHMGIGNVALSFAEDGLSIIASAMSVLLPILAGICAVLAVGVCLFMLIRWRRWLKKRREDRCTA
ncbi:DUF4126 domain-containing protein [bacterium]|nr:DUF4126 domain-containing protein [bacterium]